MARVTVEDCLDHVENRFKLVLLASKRARQLSLGTEPLVEWENDKPTVVALREIELGLVNEEMMQAALAQPIEDDLPFDEDDLAAALHAEISRELNQPAPDTGQQTEQPSEQQAKPFDSSQSTSAFGQTAEPVTSQAEIPAADETPSMEDLLAKELAASSSNVPESSNPFGESAENAPDAPSTNAPDDAPSTDASSTDFGISTPSSIPGPSTDGDKDL